AGLVAARARRRRGGRKPKMAPALVDKAQRMYDSKSFTMVEIASSCGVTPMTVYCNIRVDTPSTSLGACPAVAESGTTRSAVTEVERTLRYNGFHCSAASEFDMVVR
ncbi:hypothetical protein ACFZC5_36525, partial [Nocardia gamkensis]